MFSLLLAIIYMAFVSLGLPDSLLGSAWPVMQGEFGVPLSSVGLLTMLISGCTIVTSLFADRAVRRFGTGVVTAVSVAVSSLALFGFSVSTSFPMLFVWAIPYGVCGGAVDAALNNYVAIHYSSRQMSWLHACWGVGVTISPNIMGFCLSKQFGWEMGYRAVGVLQLALAVLMFSTLSIWKRKTEEKEEEVQTKIVSVPQALKIKGVPMVLIAFFCFCAIETTAGLWASSYMVGFRGVAAETAASFTALFYLGETVGRFLNGVIADKFGDKRMIRVGAIGMLVGIGMILLPLPTDGVALCGLVILGLGAAPVYPCIIHATPVNFGKENSQSLVGIQMASAYCGATFMPPVFGLIAQWIDVGLYPVFLGIFAVMLLVLTETVNKILAKRQVTSVPASE